MRSTFKFLKELNKWKIRIIHKLICIVVGNGYVVSLGLVMKGTIMHKILTIGRGVWP